MSVIKQERTIIKTKNLNTNIKIPLIKQAMAEKLIGSGIL